MAAPFFRSDVTAWLRRWREPLAAGLFAAFGLRWLIAGSGLLTWVGGALLLGGAAAAFVGVQRVRFRAPGGGVGVVQLDEGRLTYFGPLSGGTVDLRELGSVAFDPQQRPAHWVLSDSASDLFIPVDAEGTGALLDAFSQLPDFDMRRAVAASHGAIAEPTLLWRRHDRATADRRHPALPHRPA